MAGRRRGKEAERAADAALVVAYNLAQARNLAVQAVDRHDTSHVNAVSEFILLVELFQAADKAWRAGVELVERLESVAAETKAKRRARTAKKVG